MKKKLLLTLTIVMSAILLVMGSIVGTIAYLRSVVSIKNVFAFGQVSVWLDEAMISNDGFNPIIKTPADGTNPAVYARSKFGNEYKLMPGTTYIKDPIIHVDATSEATYLFFRIDNPFGYIGENDQPATYEEDAPGYKTIHQQMLEAGWVLLDQTEGSTAKYGTGKNIYYYIGKANIPTNANTVSVDEMTDNAKKNTVGGGNVAVDIATFTQFTIANDARKDGLEATLKNASLTVAVYAVQASGFANYEQAAEVFLSDFQASLTSSN